MTMMDTVEGVATLSCTPFNIRFTEKLGKQGTWENNILSLSAQRWQDYGSVSEDMYYILI